MTRPILVLSLTLATACEPAVCGSTQGFVSGHVRGGSGERVVHANDGVNEPFEAIVASDGSYELDLPGGDTYVLWASDTNGCASDDHELQLDACDDLRVNFRIPDSCDVADKPVLYLHPLADTPTTVTLAHDAGQLVIASDPPYGDGWRGVAHPDGTFTPDGGPTSPWLFYEITLRPAHVAAFQRETTHCVDGDVAAGLADLLGAYGFHARAQADFVAAWPSGLPAPPVAVYPQTDVDDAVALQITPPMPVHRLWFVVEHDAACAARGPAPTPFRPEGAFGLEWGVVVR